MAAKYIYKVSTPFEVESYKIRVGITDDVHLNYYSKWLEDILHHQIIDHRSLLDSKPPPSIIEALKSGEKYHSVNYYKWDVFSFGLLLL